MCSTLIKGCRDNEKPFSIIVGGQSIIRNGWLTGNPKLQGMGIPWKTLDETSQITSDFFHMKMKEVIKWELSIVIQIRLMVKNI